MHKKVLRHKYHMKLLGEMFVRKKYKYLICTKSFLLEGLLDTSTY